MFAGLGGEEKLSRRAQREKPTDEFHLGDAGDDLVAANSTTFDSDMEDLLDRYSVDVKQLDHLEGEERTEATHHLYRRNALRENRMNAWVSEQCRPLLVEYQTCFAQTRYKIPFITCAMEDNAYNHCLNLAMKTVREQSKNYYSKQNLIWTELMDPVKPDSDAQKPL